MQEVSTRARLVDRAQFKGEKLGVSTTLPRAEIEEALQSKDMPDLLLDVSRGNGGGPDVEAHIVRVALQRDDLERLLERTEGDDVVLEFDRDELGQALEPDVEGHGLREKALVLTVAAATAAGVTASVAGAMPARDVGGSSTPSAEHFGAVAASAGEAPATVIGGAVTPSDEPFGAVAASAGEAPATVIGGAVAPADEFGAVAASGDEAPAAVIGGAVAPAEAPFGAVAASGDEAPAAVIGGAVPASQPDAVPAVDTGSPLSAGEAAGIGAGLAALVITAAGFAVRGRRQPERPATT
jgi:hypothetical protein